MNERGPGANLISALVFDFDGTILDTETPAYESWRAAFERAGVAPVPLEVWSEQIGLADGDSLDVRALLCAGLGVDTVPAAIDNYRNKVRDDMLAAEPIRAGVVDWIETANELGVPLAIGSSSPTSWVDDHLERLGLRAHFAVLSCADPGIPGKPDPTVYLEACRSVGADPVEAVAIEDSANGVAAAIGSGMRCIAAPGPATRGANFDAATIAVDSLDQLSPHDWLSFP